MSEDEKEYETIFEYSNMYTYGSLAPIIIRLKCTDITLSAYNIDNDNYKYGDMRLNREANELDARRSLAK